MLKSCRPPESTFVGILGSNLMEGGPLLQIFNPCDREIMPMSLINLRVRFSCVAHNIFQGTHATRFWDPCTRPERTRALPASEFWEFGDPECFNLTIFKQNEGN